MSFESGSISFRAFYLPQQLPADSLQRFANHAAPPLEALTGGEIHGWVSGRHLLDRTIDRTTAILAGTLRLTLMKASRKIPESLLRAECRMEELARMQAENRGELDRKTRLEIRREVSARLLPNMPPQLKGMGLVHGERTDRVCVEALSEQQVDALQAAFREAIGFPLIPVTPLTAATKRKHLDMHQVAPCSFSPDCSDDEVSDSIGQDFLIWLWYFAEAGGGLLKIPEIGEFAVLVEGPLTFFMEGEGAHETVLRKGTPVLSPEAKSALLSGKKLKKASLVIARGQDMWKVTVDADEFVFRSLKLPEQEKLEPVSRFQERMLMLDVFLGVFMKLYDRFLDVRADSKKWAEELKTIRQWIDGRATRR